MGVLVGTSLIVIIPEGIETVYSAGSEGHTHGKRVAWIREGSVDVRWANGVNSEQDVKGHRAVPQVQARDAAEIDAFSALPGPVVPSSLPKVDASPTASGIPSPPSDHHKGKITQPAPEEPKPPTFYIGLSLILGFVLMFLIDKLPRHASETLQPPPPTRHISLNNLSQGLHESPTSANGQEDTESFLHSLTPSPKQTRSLATTTGLVIHAAADGIAMGASATTTNTKLGFIIFVAIMLHKAPAAFGLTSVLLKQGLSKRAARGHLIIFSLAAPFGALSTWLLVHILGSGAVDGESGQWWTGMLLLFSAGTFL
jgi:solute carrier family 39 (zinc transporter), member 9